MPLHLFFGWPAYWCEWLGSISVATGVGRMTKKVEKEAEQKLVNEDASWCTLSMVGIVHG